MADVKISDLTAASAVADANQFEINEAGTSKRVTAAQIKTYMAIWTRVTKTADESLNTNNTVQNDDALKFAMSANAEYIVRGVIFFTTGASGDFKISFNGPASPNKVRIGHTGVGGGGAVADGVGTDVAYGEEESFLGTGTDGWVLFHGIIENGVNAGDFVVQWAQATSNGTNTTVLRGSYLEYCEFTGA